MKKQIINSQGKKRQISVIFVQSLANLRDIPVNMICRPPTWFEFLFFQWCVNNVQAYKSGGKAAQISANNPFSFFKGGKGPNLNCQRLPW